MEEESRNLYTCRACLMVSDNAYPIFENIAELDTNIATLLNNCSLEVQDYEGFPNTLCINCFETVHKLHDFVETFKKSQELLLEEFLKQQKEQIVIVQDEENIANETEEKLVNELLTQLDTNPDDSVDNPDDNQSDQESVDQDFLIAQSVQLTEHYKLHKSDDESSEEEETKPQESEEGAKRQNVQKIACPLCPKTFRRFAIFAQHLPQHTRAKSFPCTSCSGRFEDGPSYLKHYQLEHRYHCEICDLSFPRGYSYHNHMKTHKPRPHSTLFTCPVENCCRTFQIKQSLRNHYRTIHSEKRNFLCNLCGSAFKNYDNWRYHMKKHKGPSHLCTYCGRRFMQAVHLTYHMWRHTGVKPFKCMNCDKSFVTKNVLDTHVKKSCGSRRRRQLFL